MKTRPSLMSKRGWAATRVGGTNQRGMVMAIALIMLLLLTIIGVTAMSTGNLQEIMARNMLDRNYAFQSGETALRDAEIDIENNLAAGTGFDSSCSNGLCLPPSSTSDPPVWEDTSLDVWDNSNRHRQFGQYTKSDQDAVKAKLASLPAYIIEYHNHACDPTVPGEELGNLVKFDKYRVTTTASGRSTSARVRLQSTFRKRRGLC